MFVISVTSFFSSLLFASSNDGGSVGRGSAKSGSPHPPTVCEGIAPSTSPAAVDASAATAECFNTNDMTASSQLRATRRRHDFIEELGHIWQAAREDLPVEVSYCVAVQLPSRRKRHADPQRAENMAVRLSCRQKSCDWKRGSWKDHLAEDMA